MINWSLILIISIIIFIIILLIDINRYNQAVLKHSKLLKEIETLNKNYSFHDDVRKHYRYNERVEYKAKLDRFDFEAYLLYKAENDQVFFADLIKKIDHNLSAYKKYNHDLIELKSQFNKNFAKKYFLSFNRLIKVEERLAKNKKLKPILDTELEIVVRYTSPRGRNSYSNKATYPYYEIKNFYQQMQLLVAQRSTRSYQMKVERIKMTATMRYQVLVRDKATCQICGASKKDGAVLHVDHIYPVAKGGKTTLDNLRTLCDRCNLGKKDRLEEPL